MLNEISPSKKPSSRTLNKKWPVHKGSLQKAPTILLLLLRKWIQQWQKKKPKGQCLLEICHTIRQMKN